LDVIVFDGSIVPRYSPLSGAAGNFVPFVFSTITIKEKTSLAAITPGPLPPELTTLTIQIETNGYYRLFDLAR
jgi:hypothetical protein